MAKIRMKECESYEFEYQTEIKVRDVNYGGHLGNDAVVGLMHEARLAMLRSKGFTELDLGDGVTGLILVNLAVNYVKQGYMHDRISILCHIDDVKITSFTLCYKITRGDDVICLAETGMASFSYSTNQLADLPEQFLQEFGIPID